MGVSEAFKERLLYTCSSAFADVRVVLVGRAMRVRRLCCGSNIFSLGSVGPFERVNMSSVQWKSLLLFAGCFCVIRLSKIVPQWAVGVGMILIALWAGARMQKQWESR